MKPGDARFLAGMLLVLALWACSERAAPQDAQPGGAPEATEEAWYAIYFTDPGAEFPEGGADEALAAAMDAARASVDVAVYELDLATIGEALIRAHQRGVKVRLATESDNMDEEAVQALKDAGIPVLGDRREGYMHNKFTVIDRYEVWTGSMNYTANDVYRNNNNLMRIRSVELAQDYTTEFEEMFVEDLFGARDHAANPYPSLTIHGTPVEVYFSPDDGVAAHILEQIGQAQESVCFLAYSYTSDAIGDAMLERAKAGVSVAGVFEKLQVKANTGDEYDRLRMAGLDVWLDATPRNMHDKVIVIDRETVITGSYNFTQRAETLNDENALIIHNAAIAALYQAECEKLLAQAKK